MAAALATLLSGCSSGDDEPKPERTAATEVCRGFAKEPAATAALKTVMESDRFEDDFSDPDKALEGLRDAIRVGQDDPTRLDGYTYCGLLPTGPETPRFKILVQGVAGWPGRDARLAHMATWYKSGVQAFATVVHGEVYFTCHLKPPAKGIVIETDVRAPAGLDESNLRRRTELITLANAAARHISKELGCLDDKLVDGVPAVAS